MDDLDWLEPDEYAVVRAFVRATKRLFAELDRELEARAGMGRSAFELLFLLHRAPSRSMRMSELAEVTGARPSGITHAVSRLETVGYVRRELCAEDRRGWFAVLTDEGAAALRRAAPVHAAGIRRYLLDALNPEERAALTEVGGTLLAHLDARAGRDRAPEAPSPSSAARSEPAGV